MGKHWVMSDLHGDYEGYMNVLQKMNFSEEEVYSRELRNLNSF